MAVVPSRADVRRDASCRVVRIMLDLGKTLGSSKWGLRWCYETKT